MKWALIQNDPGLWINYNKKKQFDIIEENDNEFKYWLDRYKYFDRYPENDQKYYKNKCNKYLLELNNQLENNQYILSDHIRLIDVAILPFIRQFANVDKKWFNNKWILGGSTWWATGSTYRYVQTVFYKVSSD